MNAVPLPAMRSSVVLGGVGVGVSLHATHMGTWQFENHNTKLQTSFLITDLVHG